MTTSRQLEAGSRPRASRGWLSATAGRLPASPALQGLLSVLLAPACLTCGTLLDRPLDGPVCDPCWRSVAPLSPPLCDRCGDVLPSWRMFDLVAGVCSRCRRRPSPVSVARAAGSYEGVLRQLVHALKYEGRRTLAKPLARLMRERCDEVFRGADLLVPVPLHWLRRQRRGFNQAADLAAELGLPVVEGLRRVRATAPQFGLPVAGRLRNLEGAFAPPRCRWLSARTHDPRLRDACVVLVDDVCTTGATLEACARVLRAGGARDVRAVTVARALSRRP